MRLVRITAVALAAAAATASAAASPQRLHGQNFFSNCFFSHVAPDDPIVYPDQPGHSHSHTFFGAKTTNAWSTLRSLVASHTTCRRSADTAAYWVPTLYSDGRIVKPTKGSAYFVLHARTMRAFPAGLKMVAGDAHAVSPQPLSVVFWSCSTTGNLRWTRPHACPANGGGRFPGARHASLLQLDVIFPDCWDGRHLDSADHRSHMAYSRNWTCPASHPVKVPRLRFIVTYPIRAPRNLTLASGSIDSGHADYFNAWHEAALKRLVSDCFDFRPRCNLPPK